MFHAGANHPPKQSSVSATNAFFIIAVLPKSIFQPNFGYGVILEWRIFWYISDVKHRYYDVTTHVAIILTILKIRNKFYVCIDNERADNKKMNTENGLFIALIWKEYYFFKL